GEYFGTIGLLHADGGIWLMSCVGGRARARQLILTAEIIVGAEGLRIGLVNRVVKAADLAAETQALAERIATGPPLALRLAKQMVNRAATSDLASALDAEAGAQAIAITSEDHQEGLAAFFEKRAPRFTGA